MMKQQNLPQTQKSISSQKHVLEGEHLPALVSQTTIKSFRASKEKAQNLLLTHGFKLTQ